MIPAASRRERVPGLDTLRFFCALWVVFAHIPPFPTDQFLGKDSLLELALRGVLKNLFCGPAGRHGVLRHFGLLHPLPPA